MRASHENQSETNGTTRRAETERTRADSVMRCNPADSPCRRSPAPPSPRLNPPFQSRRSSILSKPYWREVEFRMTAWRGPRRKVFVSFFGGDEGDVLAFVTRWADAEGVFQPIVLHDEYGGLSIDSTNPDYVMGVIRRRFLADSTVTMLLMGTCTHSRRYVDWELKASLRQGDEFLPNGLLAVTLPGRPARLALPERFRDNWHEQGGNGTYARWHLAPVDGHQLGTWIEDAFDARRLRSQLIQNRRDSMAYNSKCHACGVTHPAG